MAQTWLFDVDGVLFPHNAYLTDPAHDTVLPGIVEFFQTRIAADDMVIILTARPPMYYAYTAAKLREAGLRYDVLLCGLPTGPRHLINDCKPDGTRTAFAYNILRNHGMTAPA